MSNCGFTNGANEANPVLGLVNTIRGMDQIDVPSLGVLMRLACQVKPPVHYDKIKLERSLLVTLSTDLVQLWQTASELRLFEDVRYGQWGLILWSPLEAEHRHIQAVSERPENYRKGDLIIGEFRGDQDKLLIRCSKSDADFGCVLISLPMYGRSDWPVASVSLSDFLTSFVNARGNKFWEQPDHSQTPE